jgi:hypothetical protein
VFLPLVTVPLFGRKGVFFDEGAFFLLPEKKHDQKRNGNQKNEKKKKLFFRTKKSVQAKCVKKKNLK